MCSCERHLGEEGVAFGLALFVGARRGAHRTPVPTTQDQQRAGIEAMALGALPCQHVVWLTYGWIGRQQGTATKPGGLAVLGCDHCPGSTDSS